MLTPAMAAGAAKAAPFHGALFQAAPPAGAPRDPGLDSLIAAAQAARDSLRATLALRQPDVISEFVRWMFNLPGLVLVGAGVVGAILAVVLLRWLWVRRAAIAAWVGSRPAGTKVALAGATGLAVIGAAWAGQWGFNYSMHDRNFCYGCHYRQPDVKLTSSDSVPYPLEWVPVAHDTMSCHGCHVQTIPALVNEMMLWMFKRPSEVAGHGTVENFRCEACHMESPTEKDKWKRIATTAGHRVHLESDSLKTLFAKEGGTQCVACHGLAVHRFVPVDSTCYQKGCHLKDSVSMAIGGMAAQTDLHCNVCHQFTADVPRLATVDSAKGTLRPGRVECFTCHAMREALADFDLVKDPHGGTCGMCHNPHEQKYKAQIKETCASAACHGDWRKVKFHLGLSHNKVAENCVACHQPHAASADASDCTGCHAQVKKATGGKFAPPMPFDTGKALRSSIVPAATAPLHPLLGGDPAPRGKGDAPPPTDAVAEQAPATPAPADSFSHPRHKALACLTCHVNQEGHGQLTFEKGRGCQICHHQAPARSECAKCHPGADFTRPATVAVAIAVPEKPARTRDVPFDHAAHKDAKCLDCHVEPVTLKVSGEVRRCEGCHDQHHEPQRQCATCHYSQAIVDGHERSSHVKCDACHTPKYVAALQPERTFCLACHFDAKPKSVDHYPEQACTVCHLQATPAEWRGHLTGGRRRS